MDTILDLQMAWSLTGYLDLFNKPQAWAARRPRRRRAGPALLRRHRRPVRSPTLRAPSASWRARTTASGWWIYTEIEFSRDQVYRPDAAGWRRERVPERPTGAPITILPDWVCEIISPSKPARDLVQKKRTYHQRQIPHYWLIDPRDETLTVLRWSPDGYIEVLLAQRDDRVRAEPFAAIELPVGVFFGDDTED